MKWDNADGNRSASPGSVATKEAGAPSLGKPRLLVLTSTFPRWKGDTEPPFVYELARRLAAEFEITVLAPHARGARREEKYGDIEVRRFRYLPTRWETLCYEGGIAARLNGNRLRYLALPFLLVAQIAAIVRLGKRKEFDVIHAHWIVPQGLAAVLARPFARRRPGILCTSHGGDLFAFDQPLPSQLKRFVVARCDAFSVVSQEMLAKAKQLGMTSRKVEVIPMGVDLTTRFVPGDPRLVHPHSLIFAGRLVEKKGLQYLLEALPEVLRHHPKTHLTIAGSGPLTTNLKQVASSLGIDKNLTFTGALQNDQLPTLFQKHAIAVFPFVVARDGDREGLPVVLSEALGCGCAVVTTDIPSVNELVRQGESALIVPQRDPSSLARALINLLGDEQTRSALARKGRETVIEKMDWQAVGTAYCQMLVDLAAPPEDTQSG